MLTFSRRSTVSFPTFLDFAQADTPWKLPLEPVAQGTLAGWLFFRCLVEKPWEPHPSGAPLTTFSGAVPGQLVGNAVVVLLFKAKGERHTII